MSESPQYRPGFITISSIGDIANVEARRNKEEAIAASLVRSAEHLEHDNAPSPDRHRLFILMECRESIFRATGGDSGRRRADSLAFRPDTRPFCVSYRVRRVQGPRSEALLTMHCTHAAAPKGF